MTHVLANISRLRYNTPAVWTKWNGLVADNVAHAAGASILSPARGVFAGMRSACGGPGGLRLGSATHFWCCHSNATRAPIANPPNLAQLGGIPYHSSKLHPGPYRHTAANRHTHRQPRVTTIHFASSTTHAKCNNNNNKYAAGAARVAPLDFY